MDSICRTYVVGAYISIFITNLYILTQLFFIVFDKFILFKIQLKRLDRYLTVVVLNIIDFVHSEGDEHITPNTNSFFCILLGVVKCRNVVQSYL